MNKPLPNRRSLGAFPIGAVIVVLIAAAYWNSFSGVFVYDDRTAIVENTTIRQLWPLDIPLSPPVAAGTGGRPLANLSFALSYALSGLQPWGYHLVGIVIHGLAALALFGVVRRTLEQPLLASRFGHDAVPLAGAAAALWAVHPLHTQVVTYLSQRTESLMALFYLVTLYAVIRGAREKARLWYPLAVGACLLGVLCKEVIATAPLAVLLYDRTFLAGSFALALRRRWRLYAALAATWIPLAWLLLGVRSRGVGFGLGVAWADYAFTQCKAVLLYLKLSLWPQPLIFDRGLDLVSDHSVALACALGLASFAGGVIWLLKKRPVAGFVGAFFLLVLAPASSVIPVIQQPIAENRPHLPAAAVMVAVVLGLYSLFKLRTALVLSSGLTLLGAVATAQRNRAYASEVALWRDTVEKCPQNARAHYNYGLYLNRSGQVAAAMEQYRVALEISPTYVMAHNNLGYALAELGRTDEAIAHYERALAQEPDYLESLLNYGNVLNQVGRTAEAVTQYTKLLRLKPDHAKAHNNLGAIFLNRGDAASAKDHFAAAVRAKPDYVDAWANLGLIALHHERDLPAAQRHFAEVLRLSPGHSIARSALIEVAEGYNRLGAQRVQSGQLEEAKALFEQALAINPGHASARSNLGVVFLRAGQYEQAIAHFEAALRVQPDLPAAQSSLAEARRLLAARPR